MARRKRENTAAAFAQTIQRMGAQFTGFSGRGDVVTAHIINSRGNRDSFRVPLAQANAFSRSLARGTYTSSGSSGG